MYSEITSTVSNTGGIRGECRISIFGGCSSGFPSLLSRPSPSFPSTPFPFLPSLPFPLPLTSRPRHCGYGGLGERLNSPSGSGRSPASKHVLAHFRHKFEPAWKPENERFAMFIPVMLTRTGHARTRTRTKPTWTRTRTTRLARTRTKTWLTRTRTRTRT